VAYCFSGQVRGFPNEQSLQNVDKNFMRKFHGDGTIEQADFFYYLDFDDDANIYTVGQLGKALKQFPMKAFALHNSNQMETPSPSCQEGQYPLRWNATRNYWFKRFYYQFFKVQECYKIIVRQENLQGWKYQYLVRIRPDLSFKEPIPFSLSDVSEDHVTTKDYHPWSSVSDHFAIVPRHFGDSYFGAVHLANQCYNETILEENCHNHPFSIRDTDYPPECYLATWLKTNAVPWRGIKLSISLTRSTGDDYIVPPN
jgi:hypothetical protein